MQDNLLYSKICSLCHVKRMVFANSQEIEIVECQVHCHYSSTL